MLDRLEVFHTVHSSRTSISWFLEYRSAKPEGGLLSGTIDCFVPVPTF